MEHGNIIPIVKWTKKNHALAQPKKQNLENLAQEQFPDSNPKTMETYSQEDSIIKKRHPNICHRWATNNQFRQLPNGTRRLIRRPKRLRDQTLR